MAAASTVIPVGLIIPSVGTFVAIGQALITPPDDFDEYLNNITQVSTLIGSVAQEFFGLEGGIAAVAVNAAALYTNSIVLNKHISKLHSDLNAKKTDLIVQDKLKLLGDYITQVGDAAGIIVSILSQNPAWKLYLVPAEVISDELTVAGISYAAGLSTKTNTENLENLITII